MRNKKVLLDEIKVGDVVSFNDGKEKLSGLKITKIDLPRRSIEVTWRKKVETVLFPTDFKKGHVFKKIK